MRRAALALFALSLAACGGATPDAADGPASAARPAAQPASEAASMQAPTEPDTVADGDDLVVGPASVWQGDLSACRTGTATIDDCMLSTMRAGGASPEALAATTRLIALGDPGHVSGWRSIDGVGHAQITYPFRANTNEGLWLVDADGHAVDVDEDVLPDGAGRSHPDLGAFFEAHPDAVPFAPAKAAGSQALADGGLRLRFEIPMRSCHACEDLGTLALGYDFDADRRYIGRHLLALRGAD
ncbi:hypothetical protein [Luteimonas sp. TWI1416]|uniref:hypothetical protein n=1 Tax=unclassified Luteimonas TaxID=2629088 RepID=UPI003207FF0C